MKVQLWSDLHLEFYSPEDRAFLLSKLEPQADVLVLAGDVASLKRGPAMLAVAFAWAAERWKHVAYVPGNHEFYGTSIREGWEAIRAAEGHFSNVHALRNEWKTIGGARFYGGTGWFPEAYNHPLAPYGHEEIDLRRHMTDFRLIKEFEPAVYHEWRNFAAGGKGGEVADVIVSHHLPCEECVSPRFRGNALNCYFVSCFNPEAFGAKLWLHGHTHDRVDVTVGGTRIVANPQGYPSEFVAGIRQPRSVVLEVEPGLRESKASG